MRFFERIESQGFLGLLTPTASASVVRRGLEDSLEAMRREYSGPAEAHYVREGWAEVCRRARARRVRTLWIGCQADTEEAEAAHFAPSLAGGATYIGQVTARCVISRYAGRESPDFDDLLRTSLTRYSPREIHSIYPSSHGDTESRYDAIERRPLRRQLYRRALELALPLEEDRRPPPSPRSQSEPPCPVPAGSPLEGLPPGLAL